MFVFFLLGIAWEVKHVLVAEFSSKDVPSSLAENDTTLKEDTPALPEPDKAETVARMETPSRAESSSTLTQKTTAVPATGDTSEPGTSGTATKRSDPAQASDDSTAEELAEEKLIKEKTTPSVSSDKPGSQVTGPRLVDGNQPQVSWDNLSHPMRYEALLKHLKDPIRVLDMRRRMAHNQERARRADLRERLVQWDERYRQQVFVDLGTSSAESNQMGYWRTGWTLPHTDADGTTWQAITKKRARLYLHRGSLEAPRLWMRVQASAPDQNLTVYWNGEALKTLALKDQGWQVLDLLLPKGGSAYPKLALIANKTGTWKGVARGPRVDWVCLTAADAQPPDLPEPAFWPWSVSRLLVGRSYSIHTEIPQDSLLRWDVERTEYPSAKPLVLTVSLQRGEEPSLLLARQEITQMPSGLWPVSQWVDVSAFAGEVVRLNVALEGEMPGEALALKRLEFQRKSVQASPQPPSQWPVPKNIVIWLADTMRWDKMDVYNPTNRVNTPAFDRLAREGVTMKYGYAPGNCSKPSHAGLLSGMTPVRARMEFLQELHPADSKLISEHLKAVEPNRLTALYSANGYVSDRFGYRRDWDFYHNAIRENMASHSEYMLPRFIRAFEKNDNYQKPFFLYFLAIDPHVPYNPPKEILSLYDDKEPYHGPINNALTAWYLVDVKTGKQKPTQRDKNRLIALYDGEVDYDSRHLGKLLAKLKEWGILSRTLVLLTADHGDEFFDHGSLGHGHSLWNELIRVPLLFWYPAGLPGNRVSRNPMNLIDVVPTLMDMLGHSVPEGLDGESRFEELLGREPLLRDLRCSNMFDSRWTCTNGRYKILFRGPNKVGLYDLERDPYESVDLSQQREDIVYYFRKRMASWLRTQRRKPIPE